MTRSITGGIPSQSIRPFDASTWERSKSVGGPTSGRVFRRYSQAMAGQPCGLHSPQGRASYEPYLMADLTVYQALDWSMTWSVTDGVPMWAVRRLDVGTITE